MKQEARSERSRSQILAASLRLFSSQGYRGTNMREIAESAGVSTGNVYHQFVDKEAIFQTLLDEYADMVSKPDYPFNKAVAEGAFPEDLVKLGQAARESLQQTRAHAMLVYVDVIEFEGRHIRRFYENMNDRLNGYLATAEGQRATSLLREGVAPLTAMQFALRLLYRVFEVEVLFGVTNHYGRDTNDVLVEMADTLKFGLLKQPSKA